jgi:predicted transcriptional regulator
VKVLLNYGIIKKQKIGQNVVFRPANSHIIEEMDLVLKYPLREKIYEIIQNRPGISISEVARSLDMPNQRNKIKYHVDKLIQASLITSVRNGRISELNPIS